MPPAENVLDQFVASMGQEIGTIYAHLWAECLDLNAAWGEFEALFANKENFDVFNAAAPGFFAYLQDLMIQDLVLRVARMVDKSSQQANLSLEVLRNNLPLANKAALENAFLDLEMNSAFAVVWRNKLYAHKDLSIILGNPAKPLPDINRIQMEAAIKSINGVMDQIDQIYGGGVTVWDLDAGRASRRLIDDLASRM
jgi:AbiU2